MEYINYEAVYDPVTGSGIVKEQLEGSGISLGDYETYGPITIRYAAETLYDRIMGTIRDLGWEADVKEDDTLDVKSTLGWDHSSIVWDDCEDLVNAGATWTAFNGASTGVTTTKKYGTNAIFIKGGVPDNPYVQLTFGSTEDWSSYDSLSVWVAPLNDDSTPATGKTLKIHIADNATHYREYLITLSSTPDIYILKECELNDSGAGDAPDTSFGIMDWENIGRISFTIETNTDNVDAVFDHIILTGGESSIIFEDGINILSLKPKASSEQMYNDLMGKGAAEGINQIQSQVEDATSIGEYDRIQGWFDLRKDEDQSLLDSHAAAKLAEVKDPTLKFSITVAETTTSLQDLWIYDTVRIKSDAYNIDDKYRIKKMVFTWDGNGEKIALDVANKTMDISDEIALDSKRLDIETYHPQGATNVMDFPVVDCGSAGTPIMRKFWIPPEVRYINKVKLNVTREEYRAYSSGMAAGGGSVETTSAGGATTSSASGWNSAWTPANGSTGSSLVDITMPNPAETPVGYYIRTEQQGGALMANDHYLFRIEDVTGALFLYKYINYAGDFTQEEAPWFFPDTTDRRNHVFRLSVRTLGGADPGANWGHLGIEVGVITQHTHTIVNHTHTVTIPNHTHTLNYGLYLTSAPTNVNVVVKIGTSWTGPWDTVTTINNLQVGNDSGEIDLTPYVTSVGTWVLRLEPTGVCRLNGLLWRQVYIQSRT